MAHEYNYYTYDIDNKRLSCNDKNNIETNIIQNIISISNSYPFKTYYGEIVQTMNKEYTIYSLNYSYKSKQHKINNPDKYQEINLIKDLNYSTDKIPVYTRKIKELLNMMNNDYYTYFNYNNYLKTTNSLYNPTVNYSESCGLYTITPTLSPLTPSDIVIVNNNTIPYNAIDFFADHRLLFDMIKIISRLGKGYIIVNSLEAGSLPEMYHFHIFQHDTTKISLPKNIKKTTMIDTFEINELNIINETATMYIFSVDALFLTKGINVIALLNSLRYSHEEGVDYQYIPQVFIYIDHNDKICVGISFKKVSIDKIIPVTNTEGKPYMNSEYFSDVHGDALKKHNIIYFPFGLISYKNKDNVDLVLTDEIISDMKAPYVEHLNFYTKAMEILNIKDTDVINTMLFKSSIMHEINGVNACIDIDSQIEQAIYHNNYFINIECTSLPILYYISTDVSMFEKTLTDGVLELSGDLYYFLLTADISLVNQIKQLNENNNKYTNYFPHAFKTAIITDVSAFNTDESVPPSDNAIEIISSNNIFILYENVKSDLDTFIMLDKINLKSSVLGDTLLLNGINLIYKFNKIGNRMDNNLISNFLVTNNSQHMIDYVFDFGYIGTERENSEFRFRHYGHTIKFKINEYVSASDDDLAKDIKTFINSFHNKCIENDIRTDFINTCNDIVSVHDWRMETLEDYLKTFIDVGMYKAEMVRVTTVLADILEITGTVTEQYNEIKNRALSSSVDIVNNYDDFYTLKKIDELPDKLLFTGTNNSENNDQQFYHELNFESVYNKQFFTTPTEIMSPSSIYASTAFSVYADTTNSSRFIIAKASYNFNMLEINDMHTHLYSKNKGISVRYFAWYVFTMISDLFGIDVINRIYGKSINKEDFEIDGSEYMWSDDFIERMNKSILSNNKYDISTTYEKFKLYGVISPDGLRVYGLAYDLLCYVLQILRPDIGAIRNRNNMESVEELVIINPKKFVNVVAIYKLFNNKLQVFLSHNEYINAINKQKNEKNIRYELSYETIHNFKLSIGEIEQYILDALKYNNLTFFNRPQYDDEVGITILFDSPEDKKKLSAHSRKKLENKVFLSVEDNIRQSGGKSKYYTSIYKLLKNT